MDAPHSRARNGRSRSACIQVSTSSLTRGPSTLVRMLTRESNGREGTRSRSRKRGNKEVETKYPKTRRPDNVVTRSSRSPIDSYRIEEVGLAPPI